jgi:hypothetical protein
LFRGEERMEREGDKMKWELIILDKETGATRLQSNNPIKEAIELSISHNTHLIIMGIGRVRAIIYKGKLVRSYPLNFYFNNAGKEMENEWLYCQ